MQPECSQWALWTGKEIEGDKDLGTETLFIRKLDTTAEDFRKAGQTLVDSMTRKGAIKRVWFTKEFKNWALLREIAKHFQTVCLEVSYKEYDHLPQDFKARFTLYVKFPVMMKAGDFICVGPAFQDEAFRIGTGNKVSPEAYVHDKKIK
jgi:hypothetical protein